MNDCVLVCMLVVGNVIKQSPGESRKKWVYFSIFFCVQQFKCKFNEAKYILLKMRKKNLKKTYFFKKILTNKRKQARKIKNIFSHFEKEKLYLIKLYSN